MSERPGDDDAHDGGGVGSDGRLDPTWRAVLAAAWVGAFLCYAAVWQASVQIGIATWWVGPRGDPSSIVVRLAPFVVALAIVLHLIYQRPHAIVLSAVGVAASFALAVPDMSRSTGLATDRARDRRAARRRHGVGGRRPSVTGTPGRPAGSPASDR